MKKTVNLNYKCGHVGTVLVDSDNPKNFDSFKRLFDSDVCPSCMINRHNAEKGKKVSK